MIKINSAVKFSFMFPADRKTAFTYYSDINRLIGYLKYIELIDDVETNSNFEHRLYYNTVELGTYHIHVYCDIRMDLLAGRHMIRLVPIENLPPIETEVTLNSTKTRGYYSSEAHFIEAGDQTRIEYLLKMEAQPPRPKGMRFMPGRMVDKIAQSITHHRVKEIADAFITDSLDAFPTWLEQRDLSLTS